MADIHVGSQMLKSAGRDSEKSKSNDFITDCKGRLCFDTYLSVHRGRRQTPWTDTPWTDTSPGTDIWWWPLKRSVRILLECILVLLKR